MHATHVITYALWERALAAASKLPAPRFATDTLQQILDKKKEPSLEYEFFTRDN